MTERLSKALKQLPADQIETVADFAEFLAARRATPASADADKRLSLDWIGSAAELGKEFKSGVDAKHAATDMMAEAVERKLRR